jgi:hypothetical protein
VIAKALVDCFHNRGWDERCEKMADAVIDALEGMEVTDKMSRACWENMDGTSWNIWRAIVGAMRDE